MMVTSSRKRRHVDSSANNDTFAVGDGSAESVIRRSLEILERAQSINFEELARQYPNFRLAWEATKSAQRERGSASFSSCVTQDFSIQLTRAMLQALFRLKLPYLDEDHLCPPIPNRFFLPSLDSYKVAASELGSNATGQHRQMSWVGYWFWGILHLFHNGGSIFSFLNGYK